MFMCVVMCSCVMCLSALAWLGVVPPHALGQTTRQGRQTHHDTHEQNTLRDESGGVRLVVSSSRLSNETHEQRELNQL